jgi:hypothetical protein
MLHCRRLCRQITLQQNRCGYPVDRTFALLSADVCGNEQIFRRFRRHPFVPEDDRDGQPCFEFHYKRPHGLDGRPFATVQLKRQPQDHPFDAVRSDQCSDVGDISVQRAPFECFERLRRPPQFVAQRDTDSLGAIVERENTATHDSTA